MLYVRKTGASADNTQALGYMLAEQASEEAECVRIFWSDAAEEAFSRLSAVAKASTGASEDNLPYASLRALLSSHLPSPLYVRSDILVSKSESSLGDRNPFAQCDAPEAECVSAASTAVRAWCAGPLRQWAERRGLNQELISELTTLARKAGLVTTVRKLVNLLSNDADGINFTDARDAIHAAAIRRIAGTELFPGLGPVRTQIRSRARDNSVIFLTFPKSADRGSWSMRAQLTVETLPGHAQPFVRLTVSRIRWCPEIPTGMLPTQRTISATVFGPDERRAVLFSVPVVSGRVLSPEDPSYVMAALRSGIDPGESFAAHIQAGPRNGSFVGIPYAPSYEPVPTVATGATELDWLDCYDAITTAMSDIFEPLPTIDVGADKRVSRTNEDIPAVKAVTILEDVARTLGYNDIDDAAIADAWHMLHGDETPRGVAISPKSAEAARRFYDLREGNTARARDLFGASIPTIVVLSARADEGAAIAEVIRTLFANAVRVENRLLPVGVHGPRAELDKADRPARERYEARLAAWRPLAQDLAAEYGPCRVIVHAAKWRDDSINKIAGRIALARYGDCNVQYLDARGRKADEWFFRIQAAVLDLMFGHSGLVSPIVTHIAEAFPKSTTRPKSVIGVSVVAQAKTRSKAQSSFFLAVSIDVASGKTTALASRSKNGAPDYAGPAPFFDVLKSVASWDGVSADNNEAAKADFQDFVNEVVGPACERGERPLILFDGAHARNFWPSLSNKGYAGPHTLSGQILDMTTDWPGARVVRIQDTVEPNVVTRKEKVWQEIVPETGQIMETITQRVPTLTDPGRLVRIPGSAANYISSGDLDGQQKIAKGLSVYRLPTQFKSLAADEIPANLAGQKLFKPGTRDLTLEPYKLPGAIGILVLHTVGDDDPDRIAALCHGLRTGFGHTRSPAKMPAPLFQAQKVAEYIPAYMLASTVADDPDTAPEDVLSVIEQDLDGDLEGGPTTQQVVPPQGLFSKAEPSAISEPLLFLAARAAAPIKLREEKMTLQPIVPPSSTLPFIAKPPAPSPTIQVPEDVLEKAGGDPLLEAMVSSHWIGPLPGFATVSWFQSVAAGHSSIRTKQAVVAAVTASPMPLKRFLPDLDPRSDKSFAEFMLGLMCLAEGFVFLYDVLPKSASKAGRWIFNNFYDTVMHRAKVVQKTESEALFTSLRKTPRFIGRKLHLSGNADLVRSYFLIEVVFTANYNNIHNDAASLAEEFPDDYTEIAAFCARVARYVENRDTIFAKTAEYLDRESARLSYEWVPTSAMADREDAAQLAGIPSIIVPPVVDALWIRDKIALNGAFRSHLHNNREFFSNVLREPKFWPDEKPTSEALTSKVLEMFSVPEPVLGAVTHRGDESLFRSFYRKIEGIVKSSQNVGSTESRTKIPSDWEPNGYAPAIVQHLIKSGYRNFAADMAILRAIENPSLPLEQVVTSAGPEFAEIAAFVRSRRRASLWFQRNDESAELGEFQRYFDAFGAGERDPIKAPVSLEASAQTVLETSVMEVSAETTETNYAANGTWTTDPEEKNDEVWEVGGPMRETKPTPAELGENVRLGETEVPSSASLAETLSKLAEAATNGAAAAGTSDFAALDSTIETIRSLMEIALASIAEIPRGVSNEPLIERTTALGGKATTIADALGEDVHLPSLPSKGLIDATAASAAARALQSGESAADEAEKAIEDVAALNERARTARLNEIGAINSQVASRVSDVSVKLADVLNALTTAIPHLERTSGTRPDVVVSAPPAPVPVAQIRSDREAESDVQNPTTADRVPPIETPAAIEWDEVDEDQLHSDEDVVNDDNDAKLSASTSEDRSNAPTMDESSLPADYSVSEIQVGHASELVAEDVEDDWIDLDALHRLASTRELDHVADMPPADPDLESVFDDPENTRIDDALAALMAAGSYGLAYHLARAAETEGRGASLATTSDEAKIAAIAGHLNQTALQSRLDLVGEWVQAGFRVISTIEADLNQERASARLMAVMPLIVELGIFFPSSGAGELLRSFVALPNELGARANDVFESVSRIRHTNVTFTRAMLANVANELDRFDAMTKVRSILFAKTEQFGIMKFDFQLGMKLRNELNKSDGLMGRLRLQLAKAVDDEKTAELLRDFVSKLPDRLRVVQLLDDVEDKINSKSKGIDGAARDRFVGFFSDFRDEANNYLELLAEVQTAKQTERPKAREFAKEIAKALGGMVSAVETAAKTHDQLGIAAGHASLRLRKVASILAGEAGLPISRMADTYHSYHAEMAFLSDLDFGRSWLPSPYNPGAIIDLICEIKPPLLPPVGEARNAFFERVVHDRIVRGSYVGARVLLDAANFFDIPEDLRTSLSGELDVNLTAARHGLREDCAAVRKTVERVIRFGSLRQGGGAESATALLDRVDTIEAVEVPIIVSPEERTEDEDTQGIFDVSVAIDVLEDVKAEAQALLDEPRLRLLGQVDEMATIGTDTILLDRLRALCQSDDLLTAEEYIEEAKKTGRLPESRSANWRFAEFSQVVLPKLAHHRRDLGKEITDALVAGVDFEAIRYSALPEARRAVAEEIVSIWRELFRRFHDHTTFAAHFSTFLEKIGIRTEMKDVVERASNQRKIFVGDFKAEIETDQDSLLLPDFGSRTEGWYRIAVMQNLPNDSAVGTLCSAAKHGVLLFVGDTVSQDQRRQFYLRNLEGKRRILLIDSASIFYFLGEETLRPLTLLELAQPYSYVAPYHDWGRDAVPPEMFVGRREDIGHIFDTEGSCVVYGGRRMGKTAILRHLRATRHDEKAGTLVAFVDAQEIGKGPTPTNRIWVEIVASLPEIFGKTGSMTDAKKIRLEIKRWLEDDTRRRVLMLIDEADQFVVADASQNYIEFLALQQLMTETKRRFKFVLSGLSDVTRLVQTGNPPLKQISANPRRIGSLTGSERKDAEDLVLRPFAAIGISIQRTDVWRILSHANYYPVLIQTYSERLLQLISDRVRQSQKPIREIGSDLVAEVMEDHKVREEIKGIFQFTLGIDPRYRLIAYVVASLVFKAEAEGIISDGFRVREIRDLAVNYWDAGFQDKNRFSLFDDLLDEMEGLGIVRRINNDLWTLRSSAVVRLLGNRDEVDDAIADFIDMEAPVGFDPKSHRRLLPPTKGFLTEKKASPLTLGQERDILLSKTRVTLILGNKLADYALAPAALNTVPDSFSDGGTYDIRFLRPAGAPDFLANLLALKVEAGRKVIAIVPSSSPWNSEWVRTAIISKPVIAGDARVVFVGGPEHTGSVVGDEQLAMLTAHVSQVPLEPWSTAFFQDMVNTNNSISLSKKFDAVVELNGGWNDPMWQLIKSPKADKGLPDKIDPDAIGLTGRFGDAFRMLVAVHGMAPFTAMDVDVYADLDDPFRKVGVSGTSLVEYGTLMGLLVAAPGRPPGEERRNRYILSPLANRALDPQMATAAE
ncbi:RNaseH domain-containing protein [Rhizobium sp. LjRoot98]|uniref:RNaseH domain-containing protein n=1 Tax=Rhizobium sp. LjRoot98 TaxID=3342345 RepID=UPI003ECDD9F2